MRLVLVVFGLLVMLVGAWPILSENEIVPEAIKFIPVSGNVYQGIVFVIGLALFIYGFKRKIKIK